MSKYGKLSGVIRKIVARCPDDGKPMAEDILNFIRVSNQVLRQGSALSWEDVISAVEQETNEDLTHMRPLKCLKCGGGLNLHHDCVDCGKHDRRRDKK